MTNAKKEQVALARFAVIFPLLAPNPAYGDQSRLLGEICSKHYQFTGRRATTVCAATVLNWLRAYIAGGRTVESLYPSDRKDKGRGRRLDSATEADLKRLRDMNPDIKLTTLVTKAVKDGVLSSKDSVSMAVIYRIFREYDAQRKASQAPDMRRYETPDVNGCWMLDSMSLSTPKALVESPDGGTRQVTSKLFLIIDHRSRLVVHAQFYPNETAESLMDCLWNAFNKRGLPVKIYTDNGSAMRDGRIKLGCAELEIQLSYARPYKPAGKGCVERMFLNIRQQFVPLLPDHPLPLREMNMLLDEYLHAYHTRVHSGIGMPPLQCYLANLRAVRPAPPVLPKFFRSRVERTVSMARTVSLDGKLLQVPLGYAKRRIEVRYTDIHDAEGFLNGKSIGMLPVVDLHANARAHRSTAHTDNGGAL